MTRTAWPINAGAYARSALGVPVTALLGALATHTYSGGDVAAVIASGAGDVGVLLAGEHPTGLRRHAKTACTWAGTALGALALAAGTYEGGELSVAGLGHLGVHDAFLIAVMAAKSVLQTVVPNAPARYPDAGPGDLEEAADVAAPVTADPGGLLLGDDRLETGMLHRLTPDVLAHLDAAVGVPAQGGPADDHAPEHRA